MTNIFSVLNIGVRSLSAQQTAINICGHNIANINTPNYTRQSAILSASTPNQLGLLQVGTGAEVNQILQYRDTYALSKINLHKGLLSFAEREYSFISEVEQSLVSSNAQHLGESLTEFWQSFEEVGNNPESTPARQNLVQTAERLTSAIRSQNAKFRNQRTFSNDEISQLVTEVNQLAQEISELNVGITSSYGGDMTHANDLIDRRAEALDQLSQLIDFNAIEDDRGAVTIFVGDNRMLVSGDQHNSLVCRANVDNNSFYDIYWDDGSTQRNITSYIKGGELGANLKARDEMIVSYMENLDEMTTTLLKTVNRAHSMGFALRDQTSVLGEYAVYSSTIALNDALNLNTDGRLAYDSEAGTFNITITSGGEIVQSITVEVDPDVDSLQDIVDMINSSTTFLNASISQNKLEITGLDGHEFVVGKDTGGVLAQLGVNVLLTGYDSYDIGVAEAIANDPTLIAAGATFASGDGGNALALSMIADELVLGDGTSTFAEYFNSMVTCAGNESATADFNVKQETDNLSFFESLREQTSGVSVDEELANLVMYQQAYNSTAHFISVVNSMIDTVLDRLGS
ncbi:MAG: flagellar hook-associated protein FlgK [Candidatus Coatesbacteria bacterium]|nr:flagellar hook-associated protein FlgK [Candidatus Coatesbacteria bacterium]